jgi:hypothetical protein
MKTPLEIAATGDVPISLVIIQYLHAPFGRRVGFPTPAFW